MTPVPLTLRRPQWPHLFASLAIAVCLFAMAWAAASAITGRDALHLPATIEQIDPVPAAVRVPAQTSVFVDLVAGYTGVLIIDGLETSRTPPTSPVRRSPCRPPPSTSPETRRSASTPPTSRPSPSSARASTW